MSKPNSAKDPPGFSPDEPADRRGIGEWETRYNDPLAKKAIRFEAIYLALVLLVCLVSILLIYLNQSYLNHKPIKIFLGGLVGGVFGGTMFSIKWLYHSVAKWIWNIDRRLWRLFTPWLSGGLSLAFLLLIDSNLVSVFNKEALNSITTCVGLGFLIGYFSDNAAAKLSDLAYTLFGTTKGNKSK